MKKSSYDDLAGARELKEIKKVLDEFNAWFIIQMIGWDKKSVNIKRKNGVATGVPGKFASDGLQNHHTSVAKIMFWISFFVIYSIIMATSFKKTKINSDFDDDVLIRYE